MAEYPYLPLFTESYFSKTRHLSTEQHGAYLLLLMEAWQRKECRLEDDDQMLARLVGVSPQKWKSMKPVVMKFWEKVDGFFTNTRLSEEREFVERSRAQKKEAGKASAQKRKGKNLTAVGTAQQRDTQRKSNGSATKEATGTPTKGQQTSNNSTLYKENPLPLSELEAQNAEQILQRVDAEIDQRWPNDPTPRDQRMLEIDAADFAREGATADIFDAVLARAWPRMAQPPAKLSPYRTDIIAAVRHWITLKRWVASGRKGSNPWRADWGTEPSDIQIAAFQIPAAYTTIVHVDRSKGDSENA